MKPKEFIPFMQRKPKSHKHLIVTNNIEAKDAFGEMSHVWLTTLWIKSDDTNYGIVTYDAADRRIVNLTHWKYA